MSNILYQVYVLLCQDGSYYTGYTSDLKTRLCQHWSGKGARYTQMNKPKQIVYMESFHSRSEAMQREKAIKRLTHDAKSALIKLKTKMKC
ncbi:MAG: GIY-YIG nuclease family protein [Candidatus Bathyarchaeota archaeon]|nr:GIY-YIG nuclease family protein [Candidatus Bathyarchaeota archaeon]